jgi:mitotic-spindle organizing protein 1
MLTGIQNTKLDRQTLSLCVSLVENGVNPEALAVCPNAVLSRNDS